MKRKLAGSVLSLLALLLCAVPAYPWGWAAHTYVIDQVGAKEAVANLQEVYGGMAVDTFNYLTLADPNLAPVQDILFHDAHYEPLPLWENASPSLKPLAYGFVSHNEAWGEDWTAHIQNLTLGGHEGYVIIKARALAGELAAALQGAVGADALLVVSHELIDYGIDLLVRQDLDHDIGQQMAQAALHRDPAFPELLAATFGPALAPLGMPPAQAAALITGAEAQFRQTMVMYGLILATPDDAQMQDLLVQFLLPQAQAYFAANGINLPPGLDLSQVIRFAIGRSMQLCASDYLMELRRTRSHTVSQLAVNGVLYRGMFTANR
ncbi:MAG TPA: hypothetical protein VIU41_09250 [Geobacteraceae bacterium]